MTAYIPVLMHHVGWGIVPWYVAIPLCLTPLLIGVIISLACLFVSGKLCLPVKVKGKKGKP
jgi:hypothetical protein